MRSDTSYQNIDQYIAACPSAVQPVLQELRQTIQAAAPGARETISYMMPAFRQHKVLVYFACTQKHIGFYPTASGVAAFARELADYDCAKGTVRFPLGKPLPLDLIRQIVQFRAAEDQASWEAPKKRKK